MKLSLVRVLPLAIALLAPSAALAEEHPAKDGAPQKHHVAHTAKRAKASPKPKAAKKAPKASKKAPKASKKAPKASKKAAK